MASRVSPDHAGLRALGVMDQLVEYFKPEDCPDWMTAQGYARLPESLVLRQLRYRVGRKGFRTKEVTLVTTLRDEELYPATAWLSCTGSGGRWRNI